MQSHTCACTCECVQESTATSWASTSIETDSPEKPTAADFECWPPDIGSFVAATDAEAKKQVADYLKKTPRAWSLGRVEEIFLDGGFPMVKLILYGTADANTLKGTYGPAVRLGKEGTRTERWKFDRGEEHESKAAAEEHIYVE